MIQRTNSSSCPVRLLSPYIKKDDKGSSDLNPLLDTLDVSGLFGSLFSTGLYSLVTPVAIV
ncbi:hypothetical protein ACVWYH_001905 [Bradyrhizobium sp. GM24.11]